ncbi:glycosyltransferase family 39 protein [Wenzhouxiangella sp. AB-CW3]|uniref:glycosyltransferase family 39 protein n=1 Tax=Wenzhouxiangella sp. AB-CW3 TaxID=2771012 RepID=UPI00168BC732|nr:glycosyltransferase family 39 protein [Wenzhouxiangella sp. AB-CW3]QOC21368.1 glycosyltransferase family 39 protein [Wenzhouxiangella sp. AB-CW3]
MNWPWSALPADRWRLVCWIAVVGIALWLRLWQLHLQLLLDDEWHALHRLMEADWRSIALSFGLADYSIPLTLLFNALYESIGLHEWHMRALPLLSGLLAVVLVPALLRPWLDGRERCLLGLLIALSPLLIHFSRQVRPYALVILLGFVAIVALWRWWHEEDRRWLLLFVPAAVLSAWLHALTAVFVGAALTWFGLAGLGHWWRHGRVQPLLVLLATGITTVAACSALILPPLLTTPQAIGEKAGVDQITVETLLRSWELLVGSVQPLVAIGMLALVLLGGWRLWGRDRGFVLYWCWLLAASVMVITVLRPAWIHHALVFVRYNAVVLPMLLALVAVGTVRLASLLPVGTLARARPAMPVVAGLLLGSVLYLSGPLPKLYGSINQFTNATRHQFDYNAERTPFAFLEELPVPEFYRDIAAADGRWEVIEAPWHFETTMSPLGEYQQVHGRPVRIGMISGLCTDWTWGEVPLSDRDRIKLPRFVHLSELAAHPEKARHRFVVFHLEPAFEPVRPLPPVDECVDAFRDRFGSPWFEDDRHVVFRLAGASDDDGQASRP